MYFEYEAIIVQNRAALNHVLGIPSVKLNFDPSRSSSLVVRIRQPIPTVWLSLHPFNSRKFLPVVSSCLYL